MPYNRADLVVLMYSNNSCYTTVVVADDPSVKKSRATIDEENGIWTAPHNGDPAKPDQISKIGESRHTEWGCRHGVIGVYDRMELGHLKSMVRHGKEATDSPSSFDED